MRIPAFRAKVLNENEIGRQSEAQPAPGEKEILLADWENLHFQQTIPVLALHSSDLSTKRGFYLSL